jgi:hypothetical protein
MIRKPAKSGALASPSTVPAVQAREVRAASLQFVRKISGLINRKKPMSALAAAAYEVAEVSSRFLWPLGERAAEKLERRPNAKVRAAVRCLPMADEYDGQGKCILTGETMDGRAIIAKAYQ